MSDGPHRTLPMRAHWKLAAHRAANAAHSIEEVSESIIFASKRDILEAPIGAVKDVIAASSLFPDMRIDRLEALRGQFPRSAAANGLIDCAIAALGEGLAGDAAVATAVATAMEALARSASRGIEEHYQREPEARASRTVRVRLDAATVAADYAGAARQLLTPASPPSRRSVAPPRRSGLDQGPRL